MWVLSHLFEFSCWRTSQRKTFASICHLHFISVLIITSNGCCCYLKKTWQLANGVWCWTSSLIHCSRKLGQLQMSFCIPVSSYCLHNPTLSFKENNLMWSPNYLLMPGKGFVEGFSPGGGWEVETWFGVLLEQLLKKVSTMILISQCSRAIMEVEI